MGVFGFFGLIGHGDFLRVPGGSLGECCSALGFGLGPKLQLPGLLGRAMAELGAIFPAGCGEVSVFGAVEVCPGVEDGYIFRSFHGGQLVESLITAHIHNGPVLWLLVTDL